jgi:hypothetical protein
VQSGAVACSVQPAANLPVAIPADWLRKDTKDASGNTAPGCPTLWRRIYHGFLDDKTETRWARTVLAWFSDSRGTISILWPFFTIEVSLLLLFVAAGYGIMGRPLGAIIDDRYRMSLTLGQLCLWSILLFAGLTTLGLCNVGFGGQIYADLQKMAALPPAPGEDQVDWGKLASSYNFFLQMMAPFLTLLGFATASPVIAAFDHAAHQYGRHREGDRGRGPGAPPRNCQLPGQERQSVRGGAR